MLCSGGCVYFREEGVISLPVKSRKFLRLTAMMLYHWGCSSGVKLNKSVSVGPVSFLHKAKQQDPFQTENLMTEINDLKMSLFCCLYSFLLFVCCWVFSYQAICAMMRGVATLWYFPEV